MEWKDIPDLPNYQANKCGEIRTLNYEHKGITRVLKQSKTEKGYLKVNINCKPQRVHRLIAKTFLNNYDDKLEINHKNGIKTDNRVENLEMVTSKQNSWHMHYVLNKCVKPVYKLDSKSNNILCKYRSIAEAEKETGIDHTCIINVCKQKQKTAGGFAWCYAERF